MSNPIHCLAIPLIGIFLCPFLNEVWSQNWDGSFGLFSSYRNDRISTSIETFDATSQLIETNHLSADNINIVSLGLQGWVAFLERWSFRGYYSGGLVQGGSYSEKLTGSSTQRNEAHIKRGSCQDTSVNLGYCYPVSTYLGVGLLAGYSYDTLIIKTHHGEENGLPDPVFDGLSYRMSWYGPWMGCEAFYSLDNVVLHTCYEFHKSVWNASWKLNHADVTTNAFSDERRGRDAYGQVVYLDLFYPIYCRWTIGLKTQYQYWIAKNGHVTPQTEITNIGSPSGQVDRIHRATWSSISGQLSLNYDF